MAVIEISRKDLETLVGKKLGDKELKEKIPMIGAPLEALMKDTVQYEIFPNRPDMLSVEGFARAVKTFLGVEKEPRVYEASESGITLFVEDSVKSVRPYIACAVIKNITLTDDVIKSLMQTQEKIHQTLGRKRKKVAIGIHNIGAVKQPFYYKAVKPEETRFIPLDMKKELNLGEILKEHPKGIKYASILEGKERYPIILDKNGNVLSFPPIINGELTKVTSDVNNLFIDVTGTDEKAVNIALNILVTSLADRGGKIESVKILKGKKEKKTPCLEYKEMKLDMSYVIKLLDIDINEEKIKTLLQKMGFGYKNGLVQVPPYRADIMHQIDLVEDIAIAYGYENFEPKIPVSGKGKGLERQKTIKKIKNSMIELGFQEVVNLILTNEENEFNKMGLKPNNFVKTKNPLTTECTICRKKLIPSLLNVLSHNKHRKYPQKIFELGYVVATDNSAETGTKDELILSAAISDDVINYGDIVLILDELMKKLGIGYQLKKEKHPSFLKERCSKIIIRGNPGMSGIVGVIHPDVLKNFSIEKPTMAFEILWSL